MAFKLNDLPSSGASIPELADFVETECLKSSTKSYSLVSASRKLSISSDVQEIDTVGIDDQEDTNDNNFQSVTQEIQMRKLYCKGNYPFDIEEDGFSISLSTSLSPEITYSYLFLLFLTRLKLTSSGAAGTQNAINGPLLFEEFSQQILLNYFGNRSEGLIFGTSNDGGFINKVDELTKKLGEGTSFKTKDSNPPQANDGKLDNVVWKGFKDNRGSKLICFAQSKAGTSWREHINQLNPESFIKNWFADPVMLNPLNALIVADVIRDKFFETSTNKLVFDRCRLMDFLPARIDENLFIKIRSWTDGALNYIGVTSLDLQ